MALCSPPSPSSLSAYKPASLAMPSISPHLHRFPAATNPLRPSVIQPTAIRCPRIQITAFHTCPDTSSPSTLYQVLQIPPTASQTDIKAAYRRLARLYHPDAHGGQGSEDKEARTKLFLQIHSAYATLSDAQSRARYDIQLSAQTLKDHIVHVGTPLSAGGSYSPPRASPAFTAHYRVGRNWETDQCWC